jgi:hypothetical protein
LEHIVWVFLGSAVTHAEGKAPGYSIEPAVDADPNLIIAQGVGNVPGGNWWLVRAVAKRSWSDFFLLHWNGPEEMLKSPVLRSFVSFHPL